MQQLKFTRPAQNVDTLGDSRPLVNLNPQKARHDGQGVDRARDPETYIDVTRRPAATFQGKAYPSDVVKNPITGAGGTEDRRT